MFDRRPTTLAGALLAAVLLVLSACASEPEPKPQKAPKEPTEKRTVEVEEPSPEELANSPCGNPDWAQLPPGAEDKAPAQDEQPAREGEPADGEEADPADEDQAEQSNRVDLSPNDQPCT